MAQASPPAPAASTPGPPRDRVTLVVRCTLVLLLLVGVLSIFGESLLGLAGEPPAPREGTSTPPSAPAP